ncbi:MULTISPECIES: pseudoazurin [Marinobacter]|jgi:pseudoazurin|uniref:Pseudoazurin n=3 Tax=Marinobacter TaxID=2742 RepID=A0A5M3PZK8_9GAMM|nr:MULTISPECIES: pseudoazurin [Marinobacter]MAI33218.1 pseudoazurin [Rhodopirellula sp.]HBX39331.1 pseudoazurin [Marinobacter adhaerens]AKV95391.1 pseudoazurin [Marinobacter sp. CP1]MBO6810789.1 pseudoazurin [Marinobacter sp.]MBO6872818.1 pseudoazurin [Marinobacter sp.]|tara:strand:+ start:137 stop:586 length:450 start_codon:yes stop_codon:yes gene_type:complete
MKLTLKHTVAAVALTFISGVAMAAEHVVEMKNSGADGAMVFEPGFVKAEPGDTVKFVLVDPAHNSVSVEVPEGAEGWQGAMNEGITVTLNEEGVYVYKCTPHAALNMAGVIQVGEAVNYDSAKAAVDKLTAAAATNKDRLTGYFEQVQK